MPKPNEKHLQMMSDAIYYLGNKELTDKELNALSQNVGNVISWVWGRGSNYLKWYSTKGKAGTTQTELRMIAEDLYKQMLLL